MYIYICKYTRKQNILLITKPIRPIGLYKRDYSDFIITTIPNHLVYVKTT